MNLIYSTIDIAMAVISLAGFLLAFFIYHKKKQKKRLICPMRSDCESVINSEYSTWMGIRIEILGMSYYAYSFIAHLVLGYIQGVPEWVHGIVVAVSLIAALFSLYLIFLQAYVIKQWCVWCLSSAFLTISLFFLAFISYNVDYVSFLFEYKKIITTVHLFGMAIGVGAVTITDVFFFSFLKDYKISEQESGVMDMLSRVVWVALFLVIVSGIGLYIPQSEILNASPKFITKMMIMAIILANGIVLNIFVAPKLVRISFGESHNHKPGELHHIRKLAFALGAISITSWYYVFVLGALRKINTTFAEVFGIYLIFLAIAIIGSQIFDHFFIRRNHEETPQV